MSRHVEILRSLSAPMAPQPTGLAPRLRPMKGLEAVLFDVYGTLFISESGDVGSASGVSRAEAFVAACAASDLGTVDGVAGAEVFRALVEESHARDRRRGVAYPEVDVLRIWAETLARLRRAGSIVPRQAGGADDLEALALRYEARTNPTWAMPSARETIEALGRLGVHLGIVSNAQFYTPLLFEVHLRASVASLGFLPEATVWSYRHGQAKPSASLFERALLPLRARGVDPSSVLYVGNDMRNDMAPAARLGMRTALFAGDARSLRLRQGDPLCADVTPDLVLTRLDQLLRVLA